MPLSLFLVLGTLQLFMMMQARIMAQYAVARAARAGSLNHGACDAMNQAAIAALLPAIHPYLTPGGTASGKYWSALQPRLRNKFYKPQDFPHDETIVWILREGTTFNTLTSGPNGTEETFDLPYNAGIQPSSPPLLLELRMIFWFPLKIPFANYVMSRMAEARYNIQPFTQADPLMLVKKANWVADPQAVLATDIKTTLADLIANRKYSFPIQVTYVTRMMTPPRLDSFPPNDCRPPP